VERQNVSNLSINLAAESAQKKSPLFKQEALLVFDMARRSKALFKANFDRLFYKSRLLPLY